MINTSVGATTPDQNADAVPKPGLALVEAREYVARDVVMLTLRPSQPLCGTPPGSHIDVRVPLPNGVTTRSYSLVDLGDDDGRLRIAVRLDPTGRGGSAWMHALQPGMEIEVDGPFDAFPLSPDRRPSLLVAAGIGITPVLGLARAIRKRGTPYDVVYIGRSRDRMAFADHLEEADPDRVTIIETESGPRPKAAQLVGAVPADGVLYVCGPMGLLTDLRAEWQRAGRPAARLRFETFGTSGVHPARPFTVGIPSRGVQLDVPVGTSLLDALAEAGIEVLYDCLRGECGLCRVEVLSSDGPIDHRDVFLSERQRAEARELCACVSRVAGTSITIEC